MKEALIFFDKQNRIVLKILLHNILFVIQTLKNKGTLDRILPQCKILLSIKCPNPKYGCYNKICHVLVQVETEKNNRTKKLYHKNLSTDTTYYELTTGTLLHSVTTIMEIDIVGTN
jgi:hypothetical protein